MALMAKDVSRGAVVPVEVKPSALKKCKAWEYAVRFVMGGLITAAVGVISHVYGPAVAGVFLAFPAILPASLTLVKQHDGRLRAEEDARGAAYGALSLLAFAAVLYASAQLWPPVVVLLTSGMAWLATSALAWALRFLVVRRGEA